MNEVKSISKSSPAENRTTPKKSKDQKTLDKMIAKNPNLKTLIDKLDLVTVKTSQS